MVNLSRRELIRGMAATAASLGLSACAPETSTDSSSSTPKKAEPSLDSSPPITKTKEELTTNEFANITIKQLVEGEYAIYTDRLNSATGDEIENFGNSLITTQITEKAAYEQSVPEFHDGGRVIVFKDLGNSGLILGYKRKDDPTVTWYDKEQLIKLQNAAMQNGETRFVDVITRQPISSDFLPIIDNSEKPLVKELPEGYFYTEDELKAIGVQIITTPECPQMHIKKGLLKEVKVDGKPVPLTILLMNEPGISPIGLKSPEQKKYLPLFDSVNRERTKEENDLRIKNYINKMIKKYLEAYSNSKDPDRSKYLLEANTITKIPPEDLLQLSYLEELFGVGKFDSITDTKKKTGLGTDVITIAVGPPISTSRVEITIDSQGEFHVQENTIPLTSDSRPQPYHNKPDLLYISKCFLPEGNTYLIDEGKLRISFLHENAHRENRDIRNEKALDTIAFGQIQAAVENSEWNIAWEIKNNDGNTIGYSFTHDISREDLPIAA